VENQLSGVVNWKCPSNIAIIKYWGKYGAQLPRNPSISFTLDACYSITTIRYRGKTDSDSSIRFRFDGQENAKFGAKVQQFIESLYGYMPILEKLDLEIESSNSFPHSTGIASSASAMGALALCLVQIENEALGLEVHQEAFLKKASFFARLGSGSACRSIYPLMGAWGESTFLPHSNNEFAIDCSEWIHPVFHTMNDCILIADSTEKKVSSRAGHGLMENNPYATARYQEANDRYGKLIQALREGDLQTFGAIAEAEALTLHALMMASSPPYILIRPNTLKMIQAIQDYRTSHQVPVYFTLDAGPNIHLLYPDSIKVQIQQFIEKELAQFCEGGQYIKDHVGQGPVQVN